MRLEIKPEAFDEFRYELARNHPTIINNIAKFRTGIISTPDTWEDLARLCYMMILGEEYGYNRITHDFTNPQIELLFRIKYSDYICT